MERLAGTSDLASVLNLIIDSLRDSLHADRATVYVYDAQSKELCISQAHGLSSMRFPVSGPGIAAEAARTGITINLPDAYADPRFNQGVDKATGYRTRNMLTIPLMSFDGGLEGVAQVLNKDPARGQAFDALDETVARALASQAAVAIRRARFIEGEKRKQKIEADLQLARSIQQSAFPQNLPTIPGFSVAAGSIPAEETGGDTYDFVDWGQIAPDRHGLLFVLADATGHGIGPALSVAQFRGMFLMAARVGLSLLDMARHLNEQLVNDLPPGRFVTAFWGHLDARSGASTPSDPAKLHYQSAGQAPILVVRADGSILDLPANSLPVGIATGIDPDPVEPIDLHPGDVFLLLSDGYFEAPSGNGSNEQYGNDRVIKLIRDHPLADAQGLLKALNSSVEAFAGGTKFPDDRTGIIIRRSLGGR